MYFVNIFAFCHVILLIEPEIVIFFDQSPPTKCVLVYVTHLICSAQRTFTHSASDCCLLVCASGFGL